MNHPAAPFVLPAHTRRCRLGRCYRHEEEFSLSIYSDAQREDLRAAALPYSAEAWPTEIAWDTAGPLAETCADPMKQEPAHTGRVF